MRIGVDGIRGNASLARLVFVWEPIFRGLTLNFHYSSSVVYISHRANWSDLPVLAVGLLDLWMYWYNSVIVFCFLFLRKRKYQSFWNPIAHRVEM
uniref:Uncharacterized protein n=1 Tax=Aegilops tauschii subsp. strangulata TaxID=200361 RepID=A0A453SFV7_AEGTS